MSFVILDLEFNQPTRVFIDPSIPFEIIEVGAVKVDNDFNVIDTFRVYVKNTIYKLVNWNVEELTGITIDDLAYGIDFEKVSKMFSNWVGKDSVLHWGDKDLTVWRDNCSFHKLVNRGMNFIDVQDMFRNMTDINKIPSLKKAASIIGITFREEHTALIDSYNLLKLLCRLKNSNELEKYINTWWENNLNSLDNNLKILNYDKKKFITVCPECDYETKHRLAYCNNSKYHILASCENCRIDIDFVYSLNAKGLKKRANIYGKPEFKKEKHKVYYNCKNFIYYNNYETSQKFEKDLKPMFNIKPKTLIDVINMLQKTRI